VHITDPDELWEAAQLFMQHDPPLTQWYFKSLGIEFNREALAANAERVHLLRFDALDDAAPVGQQVDLAWLWPLALLVLLLMRRVRR
jgi:MYXO-CTERM domain-containing protein